MEALWLMLWRSNGLNPVCSGHLPTVSYKLRGETSPGIAAIEYRIKPDYHDGSPMVEYRFDDAEVE